MYEMLLVNKNRVKTTFDNDFSLYVVDCVLLVRRIHKTLIAIHNRLSIRYSEANNWQPILAPAAVYFSFGRSGKKKKRTKLSLCRQGNEMRHSLFALSEYCCWTSFSVYFFHIFSFLQLFYWLFSFSYCVAIFIRFDFFLKKTLRKLFCVCKRITIEKWWSNDILLNKTYIEF